MGGLPSLVPSHVSGCSMGLLCCPLNPDLPSLDQQGLLAEDLQPDPKLARKPHLGLPAKELKSSWGTVTSCWFHSFLREKMPWWEVAYFLRGCSLYRTVQLASTGEGHCF